MADLAEGYSTFLFVISFEFVHGTLYALTMQGY